MSEGPARPNDVEEDGSLSTSPALRAAVKPSAPRAAEDPTTKPTAATARKCPTCKSGGRNLAVFIDGTSEKFSNKRNTNVVEMYSRLDKDDTQLTYYNSGIGTYARPSWKSPSYYNQVIANKLDLAFALRFEKIIMSAYEWLADNYKEGDCIFLFGFSRGGYQVRALSAMIEIVGLIHKGNKDQIPFAYELYAASKSGDSNDAPLTGDADLTRASQSAAGRQRMDDESDDEEPISMQERFKRTFSRSVKIHFVGAWDTVSSVGIFRSKTLPMTTNGMKHVCFFRHALAMQEYRVKFLPEYVRGGSGPAPDSQTEHVASERRDPASETTSAPVAEATTHPAPPHTKEVWFHGCHSDIGGGGDNAKLNKFGPALRWMSFEALIAGLKVGAPPKWANKFPTTNSLSLVWRIIEILPIKRLSYKTGTSTTRLPHFGSNRVILDLQLVHETVPESLKHHLRNVIEDDPWTSATALVAILQGCIQRSQLPNDEEMQRLQILLASAPGQLALRELGNAATRPLVDILNICKQRDPSSPNQVAREVQQVLFGLASSFKMRFEDSQLISEVLRAPVDLWTIPLTIKGHAGRVTYAAFTPDGERIVSASWDDTIRTWDARTGTSALEPIRTELLCITLSPDGSTICSGATDGTLTLWVAGTGAKVLGPLSGHADNVYCVAFSPDNRYIVSSSGDRTIRVWNAATGEAINGPITGHTGVVLAVAFFPDSQRVVSGSSDQIVRVWNVKTGQQIGDPLHGHTHRVWCVAVSPDRTSAAVRIASGSFDNTIRIWDGETRELLRKLHGHSGWVKSIAFSPVTGHLVSGSEDRTIRLWDVETGEQVGEPIEGHSDWVRSVAFSPDGTRVVSGSDDRTVRVWDRVPVKGAQRRR